MLKDCVFESVQNGIPKHDWGCEDLAQGRDTH